MSFVNFFNNIGKWRLDSQTFAKLLFFPLPDNNVIVQIQRFDPQTNSFVKIENFQNDFEFWMIGGHLLKWFTNLCYTTSSYDGFFKKILGYVILSLDKEKQLNAPDGIKIDSTQSKIPYVEIIISKSTHGMQTLAYNITAGEKGHTIELYMLGLTIRHFITIYPQSSQLLSSGFGLLLHLQKNGYSFTDTKQSAVAVSAAMDNIAKKILEDAVQGE